MVIKFKSQAIDELFEAILALETEDECYCFFEDVATIAELKSLSQRLQVAKMILQNETYTTISQVTGASTATISRVKSCIYYGTSGYKMIIDRVNEKNSQKGKEN